MTIGILAVQGAFIEQAKVLDKLGVSSIELRKASDLENHIDGLILPGGESTVQGKLLRELRMYDILKEKIENGLPVLATCAGMILLASQIDNDTTSHFGTIPMTVNCHRESTCRRLRLITTESERICWSTIRL